MNCLKSTVILLGQNPVDVAVNVKTVTLMCFSARIGSISYPTHFTQ